MKPCEIGVTGSVRCSQHTSTRTWLAFFVFSPGTTNKHATIVRESWVSGSFPPPLTQDFAQLPCIANESQTAREDMDQIEYPSSAKWETRRT
jgi:hypothetical protein